MAPFLNLNELAESQQELSDQNRVGQWRIMSYKTQLGAGAQRYCARYTTRAMRYEICRTCMKFSALKMKNAGWRMQRQRIGCCL